MAGWLDATDTFYAERQRNFFSQRTKKDYAHWPQGVFKPLCIACGFLFLQYFSTFKSERSLFKIIIARNKVRVLTIRNDLCIKVSKSQKQFSCEPKTNKNIFVFLP